MKKTYQGSCHCGAVRFETELDLAKGTSKCNCRLCWKQRRWSARSSEQEFRVLAGTESLGDESRAFPGVETHHRFCTKCGIALYSHGLIEAQGGPFLSVSLAALDDLPTEELLAAPVTFMDGRHDDWWHAPAEARHL